MVVTDGDRNTATGSEALRGNTTGDNNTAIGEAALTAGDIARWGATNSGTGNPGSHPVGKDITGNVYGGESPIVIPAQAGADAFFAVRPKRIHDRHAALAGPRFHDNPAPACR